MFKLLRLIAFAALLASAHSTVATPVSPNFTDLWWNPAESGWGVNIDQQGDVIFATFFVYGQDNQPVWYAGVLNLQGTGTNGVTSFAGDLYQTRGPWFTGSFNPAAVTQRKVGTASLQGTTNGATLSYSVDAVLITKQIQRQTLRENVITGSYLGATTDVTSACSNATSNGLITNDVGVISIIQVADVVTIFAPTCTFTGTRIQQGQTTRLQNGVYSCKNGAQGVISFSDIYVEQSGIIGKYVGHDNACSFVGTIGGARRQ